MTVQDPLAGIVPPESVKVPGFVTLGDANTVPAHVVEAFGTVALRRLAGYVSANDAPVIAVEFRIGQRDCQGSILRLSQRWAAKTTWRAVGGSNTVRGRRSAVVLEPALVVSPLPGSNSNNCRRWPT